MMRCARSVACSNTDDIEGAKAERDAFLAARGRVPEPRMLFNNSCRDILAVAEQMLLGELAYREGNHDIVFDHLRQSVELDDNLPYDEPGDGCSRSGMHWGRCCWSRVGSMKPKLSTGTTSVSTQR